MTTGKKIPGGGKKGGTMFPRIALKQAVEYARKLVAKTHANPQPDSIILKGVFDSSGSRGKIRASALRQFDLLEGDVAAISATALAKEINSAPAAELPALLHRSCLTPKLFKKLFDTFQNDTLSRAKIRQQALQLGVHPDFGDDCVQLFVKSLQFAGLATLQGDDVTISATPTIPSGNESDPGSDVTDEDPETAIRSDDSGVGPKGGNNGDEPPIQAATPVATPPAAATSVAATPGINVTLSLDSTMDPEKLERQLKLLRQYGVLK
jgi:hypothetical protein